MKTTETLFSKSSGFDAKNITNKSNVQVPENVLKSIENGVSIETLDKLQKEHSLKIFKYRTQITIHGIFPEVSGFYVGGYYSIFQNKNKSIGVKLNAVDSEKRDFLQSRLKFVGFSRSIDSSRDFFTIQTVVDENNIKEVVATLKAMYDRIDETSFFGTKDLYLATSPYGRKYACLDLNINAIYQEKMQVLLDSVGYNKNEHEKQLALLEKEEKERHEKYMQEKAQCEIIAEQVLKEVIQENERLATIYTKKPLESGVYVKAIRADKFYKPTLKFQAYKVTAKNGRKQARFTYDTFKTLQEALEYSGGYSERILKREITAFKI